MKKNVLFFIPMMIILVLLFLLRFTGIEAHIIASVIGLLILVVHTLKTKKEWKCPAIEIIERVFYAIALVTGGVLMKVYGVAAISIIHKVSAVLFVLLFVVNEIRKNK